MLYIACFLWGVVCADNFGNKATSFILMIAGAMVLAYLDTVLS